MLSRRFSGLRRGVRFVTRWIGIRSVLLLIVGASAAETRAVGAELPPYAIALGWRDRPADFLNAADVVTLASWTEGHSNVAGEALMLGRADTKIATLVTPRITWPAVQRRQCMKQTHQLRRLDQLGQFLTRIKHARFHRGLTDADYFGNLCDGFAVIVNQVDNLAVLGDSRAKD